MNTSSPLAAEFLQYNRWANLHLIDALLTLTPEQLASSAPGTYGSIYDTLVHIIQAETRYYRQADRGGTGAAFLVGVCPFLIRDALVRGKGQRRVGGGGRKDENHGFVRAGLA